MKTAHTHIYALIYCYQRVFKTPHIKTSCVLYSKPYTTDFLLSIMVFKMIHIRQTGQYWKLHILSNPWSVFKLHTFSEILWSVFKITHIIILTVVCIQNSCTLRGNAVCLPNHLYLRLILYTKTILILSGYVACIETHIVTWSVVLLNAHALSDPSLYLFKAIQRLTQSFMAVTFHNTHTFSDLMGNIFEKGFTF